MMMRSTEMKMPGSADEERNRVPQMDAFRV